MLYFEGIRKDVEIWGLDTPYYRSIRQYRLDVCMDLLTSHRNYEWLSCMSIIRASARL